MTAAPLITSFIKPQAFLFSRSCCSNILFNFCRSTGAIAATNCLLGSLCSMQLGDQLTGNSPPTFIQTSEGVSKIGDLLIIATRATRSAE